MANPSKKTKTKSSTRKKPVQKRTRRKSTKGSTFKKSMFVVLGVLLMISMVIFGYFLGQKDRCNGYTSTAQTSKPDEKESKRKLLADLAKIKTQKPQEQNQDRHKPAKPLIDKKVKKESIITKEDVPESKQYNRVMLSEKGAKPKLAIIIDDVSNRRQLSKIQATGLKITPSIFPPSKRSMTSHHLAKGLEHYMIHLPMESGSAQFNKQTKTLITTFSKEQIEARVKELRVLFPTARYINNHTGSVFTDNYAAMQTLYRALRKEGFVFVDSRTIASTKVPRITEEYGDAYVARDVFIDNEQLVPSIHRQLQKAVMIAKRRGYAIAIGHPHQITMKALSSAAAIFNEVELVYMDELYQ